jgi:phage terminase large subunit-like protein
MELQEATLANQQIHQRRIDYFVAHYLKDEMPLTIPTFHQEIYSLVQDKTIKRLAIIAPAGFGKSSVVSYACPIWLAAYHACNEILIISASAEFAEYRLRHIRYLIESNENIQKDFNLSPGSIWRDNEIILSNGVRILARGKGSQITGMRPDVILCDDIETEDEAKSEIERAHLKEWWYATLVNRPAPDGRIVIIGSISSRLAWMNEFLSEQSKKAGWVTKQYATKDCRTIWPEKWTDAELFNKRIELAPYPGMYEALYEADTSQIQKYAFKKEWLRYYDRTPDNLNIFTVVDPAIGERLDHDFTAIVTGGIDTYGNVFLLDIIKKRFNLDTLEMFGALFTIYEVYRPIRIGFESVAFQKYVKLFFESECKKRSKFPSVVEIKHDTQKTKSMRITSLAPLAQGGNLFIKPDMYDFISEWESYPEVVHDDVLDAASMLKDIAMPRATSANRGNIPKYVPSNARINF